MTRERDVGLRLTADFTVHEYRLVGTCTSCYSKLGSLPELRDYDRNLGKPKYISLFGV